MKMSKILSFLLAGTLTAGMLAGCAGKGEEKETEKKEAKGSYVEEDMEIPWEEDSEAYLGSFLNDENQIEIYTANTESVQAQVFSYRNTGGDQWERQEETWAEEVLGTDSSSRHLIRGQDKKIYLLTSEDRTEEYQQALEALEDDPEALPPLTPMHLYCYTPEDGTSEIPIESLTVEGQQKEGDFFYTYYLGVTKSGDVALTAGLDNGVRIYDRETGKEKYSLDAHEIVSSQEDGMSLADGDNLVTLGANGKELLLYDTKSGEQTGVIELKGQDSVRIGRLCSTGDGTYYLLSNQGITVYRENGNISEQIFDGNKGRMVEIDTKLTLFNFFAGADDDFYGIYWDYNTGEIYLCHYYYNGAVNTETEEELTVYGLYESKTIEDGVRAFEKAHPEVSVDYQYALKEEEEGNPEDYIDTLNTQLLNKEGADVLILDDLPVDSYIEKGILEDLSDYRDKLVSDGTVLENVAEAMKTDGKTYQIPANVTLPVFYGTEDAVNRLESLESVESYLEEHPDGKVVGAAAKEQLAYLLFAVNYTQLWQEDGSISQEKIARILDTAEKLYENNPSEDLEEAWNQYYRQLYSSGNTVTPFDGVGMDELYTQNDIAGVNAVTGISSLGMMCDIVKQQEGMAVQDVNGYFIPKNSMGINASSEKKDLAQEFISTVLGSEVQESDYGEGMPVRTESLEKQGELSEQADGITQAVSYADGTVHSFGNPSAQEVDSIVELVKKADTPLILDLNVRKAFLDCTQQYFGGGVSAEEAAKSMGEKMDLYLSE